VVITAKLQPGTVTLDNGEKVRVLVQHGLMPQPRSRLDLAALSLGCQRLLWGSGVVGIGLCTRELYWDLLARAITSRPPECELWAGIWVSDGG